MFCTTLSFGYPSWITLTQLKSVSFITFSETVLTGVSTGLSVGFVSAVNSAEENPSSLLSPLIFVLSHIIIRSLNYPFFHYYFYH